MFVRDRNDKLREYAYSKGVYLYEVAEKLGICPVALSTILRKPLSQEQQEEFINAVDEKAAEIAEENKLRFQI